MPRFTIFFATKHFVWNNTLVGKNQYYGWHDGKPFISNGIKLKNGTVMIAYRVNAQKNTWVDKMYPVANNALAKELTHRTLAERRRIEAEKDRMAKISGFNPTGYVPSPKTYLKLDQ